MKYLVLLIMSIGMFVTFNTTFAINENLSSYVKLDFSEVIKPHNATISLNYLSDPENSIYSLKYKQYKFFIPYKITNASMGKMVLKCETSSLLIYLQDTNDGNLTVNVPRQMLNSRAGYDDGEFIVLSDKKEVPFEETEQYLGSRTLRIPITKDSKIIEIIAIQWPEVFEEYPICSTADSDESIYYHLLSPLEQSTSGISIDQIRCKEELNLVTKSSDGSPACVRPETKQKLIERGWAKQDSQKTKTSTTDPDSNQYPTIIFPQNATGSSPDSGPIPHTTVVLLGINDTVSWINESDRTIIIRAVDDSWNAGEITPYNQINVKFNHTGQYVYLIDILEDNLRAQGEIIVLGDDIDSLPIEERLKMAQAILGQHFRTLPIVGIGAGNADNVLEVTIHEDELEKFTDAQAYYKTKVQEIIPVDIPIRIDFGQYAVPD